MPAQMLASRMLTAKNSPGQRVGDRPWYLLGSQTILGRKRELALLARSTRQLSQKGPRSLRALRTSCFCSGVPLLLRVVVMIDGSSRDSAMGRLAHASVGRLCILLTSHLQMRMRAYGELSATGMSVHICVYI